MLRLFSLLFLAASLFLGCVSIGFFGEDVTETCGGEKHISVEQICEEGVLKNLCGNGYYDPKMQFCLNDIVFEKCNGNSYNPVNQKCEDGIVLNKCGNDYYNQTIKFCSDDVIYDKCNGNNYNPSNQKCENNVLLSKCGSDYYNPLNQNQKCENGVLLAKCGDDYYNPINQKCEGDILFSKCGNVYYNTSYYKCENDILLTKCGDEYYDPPIQFCYDNAVYDKCAGNSYDPSNYKCVNDILLTKCGNEHYNPTIQFCYSNAVYDKCAGNSYNPSNYKCENDALINICGNEIYDPLFEHCFDGVVKNNNELKLIIDNRDGKTYKYVPIGTQIWMAENLRRETSNTKCYGDNPDNCEIYGIMYDWNTAKTACPSGWHLPNDAEWNTLRDFIGSNNAGTKLKANSDLWISGKGTDDFGFTALPGGAFNNSFTEIRETAGFWSATAGSQSGSAHFRYLKYNSEILNLAGFYTNNAWANVRCIKD